jgi:hypothetical protein
MKNVINCFTTFNNKFLISSSMPFLWQDKNQLLTPDLFWEHTKTMYLSLLRQITVDRFTPIFVPNQISIDGPAI